MEQHRDYFERRLEEKEEQRDRYRLAEGMLDFGGVIAGAAVCLVLVVLIASLANWLLGDIRSVFSVVLKTIGGAK
ncbi:MAG: hypothetical protein MJ136_04250 [Clostridia bacterium]|nr:hypothetical protein [Clostridia bacterium]